jgi:hypothetical protein
MEMSDERQEEVVRKLSKTFDRCGTRSHGSHWLKKGEVLTDSYGAEILQKAHGNATAKECGDLVLFEGIDGDPHDAIEAVKKECKSKWGGYAPDLSPNHLVGVALHPVTGDVSGQGITFGSGEGVAQLLDAAPADRPDSTDGEGVTVGCFDTGIADHSWLDGGYLAMPDDKVLPDANPENDLSGHGTFIAGLILQQAPAARVLVKKVLSPEGFTDSFDLACAIHAMADEGIDVLNLSMGLYTHHNEPPFSLRLALAYMGARTTVVAAAGNHDPRDRSQTSNRLRPFWPAAFRDVIAVGATDVIREGKDAEMAGFSNHGPWLDVWARGVGLASTFVPVGEKKDTWAHWSGTSFSAAVVSGAIAATMTREGGIPAPVAASRLLGVQGGPTLAGPRPCPVLDLWPTAAVKGLDGKAGAPGG